MSPIFLLALLALFSSQASAQNQYLIDSLESQLPLLQNDSLQVEALNELAFQLRHSSPSRATEYAHQAKATAQKIGFAKGHASSLVRLGIIATQEGNYDTAKDYYIEALEIRKTLESPNDIANTYNNIGLIYKYQGGHLKSIENYMEGLRYLKEKDTNKAAAILYNNLGNAYRYIEDYKKAIENINNSIEIRQRIGDQNGRANCLLNLGNLYLVEIENLELAERAFEQSVALFRELENFNGEAKCSIGLGLLALKKRNFEGAEQHLNRASQLKNYLNKNDKAVIQMNLGELYIKKMNYDRSIPYLNRSLKTFEELGNTQQQSTLHYNLGVAYFNKSNFSKALLHFEKSLAQLNSSPDIFFKTQLFYNLSQTHARLGNFSDAFEYSNYSAELQDSLDQNYKMAMNLLLKNEEEQKKMELLAKEQQLQIAKNQRNTLIINALIALLLLFSIAATAGFHAYRNRKRQQLAEKNELLAKQKVAELLNNQELKATYARLEGQDKERKRIAQDLHDRLGSMLSTVKLYFKAIDSKIEALQEDNQKQYQKATALLDDACEEVRKVAHNLESGMLAEFGLKKELETLANSIESTNQLKVKILTHGLKERLDSMMEAKIYRIIQELVNNVIKHAKASVISIQLNHFQRSIEYFGRRQWYRL